MRKHCKQYRFSPLARTKQTSYRSEYSLRYVVGDITGGWMTSNSWPPPFRSCVAGRSLAGSTGWPTSAPACHSSRAACPKSGWPRRPYSPASARSCTAPASWRRPRTPPPPPPWRPCRPARPRAPPAPPRCLATPTTSPAGRSLPGEAASDCLSAERGADVLPGSLLPPRPSGNWIVSWWQTAVGLSPPPHPKPKPQTSSRFHDFTRQWKQGQFFTRQSVSSLWETFLFPFQILPAAGWQMVLIPTYHYFFLSWKPVRGEAKNYP